MPIRLAQLFALLALLGSVPAHAMDSLRCGSRVVSVDAIDAEVIAACGEPSYRDHRVHSLPRGRYDDALEVWYYNAGSSQLIRVLTFRDGKLVSVDNDGYGFTPPADHVCGPGDIFEGWSKFRLLAYCGEPVSKHAVAVTETVISPTFPHGRLGAYPTEVYREEWVYNFGPNYFLRKVTLENGVVTDIQNGNRGFDPH
jgi:hypothetical protein